MFVRCPHCETIFQITDEHLSQADGRVRCGQCLGAFNALRHVTLLQDEAESDKPVTLDLPEPPTMETAVATDNDYQLDNTFAATTNEATPADSEPALGRLDEEPIPEVLEQDDANQAAGRFSLSGALFTVLLIVGLLAQYLYFMPRDALTRFPAQAPMINKFLSLVDRVPPEQTEPAAFEVLSREVIAHPRFKGALSVTAQIVNRASYAQAFPVIRLTLFDVNGKLIAQRDFQRHEYVNTPNARVLSEETVAVELELASPRTEAVSYEFTFL